MLLLMLLLLLLQSTVMLVFREEKNPEDEAKAWQFWHGRQHSVKQRILDAGRWSFACDYSCGLFRCCLRRFFFAVRESRRVHRRHGTAES